MSALPETTVTALTAPRGDVAKALETRANILEMTAAAERAVLSPVDPGAWPHSLRAALAARIALLNGDEPLASRYAAMADAHEALADPSADGAAQGLAEVLTFMDRVTADTRNVSPADIDALQAAGVSDADIVRLAEIGAFHAYQTRLIAGLQLMQGRPLPTAARSHAPAARPSEPPRPGVVHKFTRTVPEWRPRVTPIRLEEATDAQLDALQVTPSNTKVSAYVLTLAHDVETLKVRSPLFNAIMYDSGGMNRAERELGALAASMVNRCIYCAAVHAARHAQLTKDTAVTDAMFAQGEAAALGSRDRAIFDLAFALAKCPPAATQAQVATAHAAGLDMAETLDLVLSSALFGWANRLMHVLGDPVRKEVVA